MQATHTLRTLAVAALALLGACSSETVTAPAQDESAKAAVTTFTQLSDSIARSGGDSAIGNAYAGLAETIRQGGRVSPIVITIDGVAMKFSATALQTEISSLPCPGTPSCPVIARVYTLRTLVAWQQDDPRRIVQLSSESNTDPIRAYLFPVLVPFPGASASLTFYDGKGGAYFGTSGLQKFSINKSETSCTKAGADRPVIAIYPAPARCTQADFVVSFDGKAEPSQFLARNDGATGSHTFSMSSQAVSGALFEYAAATRPTPPIDIPSSTPLPSTLTVTRDSVVTLTLTVRNPTSAAVQVVHPSSQRFDFTITDSSTGLPVWKWSDGQGFFQALTAETIAADGTLTYSVSWKPAKAGPFVATGELASISHRSAARATFVVP